jgi:hypothetical protein
VRRAESAEAKAAPRAAHLPARLAAGVAAAFAVAVGWMSVPVVTNLCSGRQVMNTSFGPWNLVNTYGAFGSVGRERLEIVFEGTTDPQPGPATEWREYAFKCAPCDPARRPCVITPYHYRLDWQMWFAAMSTPGQYPWTLRFVWKLLHGDPGTLSLLAGDPFPGTKPRFVRARLYVYRFAPPGSGRWWDRTLLGDWIPPLSADDPRLLDALRARDWDPAPGDAGSSGESDFRSSRLHVAAFRANAE